MRQCVIEIIEWAAKLYGPPSKGTSQGAYGEALDRALARFDDDQIDGARDQVEATFVPSDVERWPLPPRFIEAIEGRRGRGKEQVFNSIVDDATRARLNADLDAARSWAGEQIARSEIGHDAIRQGWVRELASQARQRYVRAARAGDKPPTIEDIARSIRADMRARCASPLRRADALVVVGHHHAALVDRLTADQTGSAS